MGREAGDDRSEQQVAAALGIGRYKKHILYCAAGTCASEADGLSGWNHLKTRLRDLGIQGRLDPLDVFRTKSGCLRVCRAGPIMVVYPEGVWYRRCTPEVIDRILEEHVLGGRVVEEHAFAHNPLSCEVEPGA